MSMFRDGDMVPLVIENQNIISVDAMDDAIMGLLPHALSFGDPKLKTK